MRAILGLLVVAGIAITPDTISAQRQPRLLGSEVRVVLLNGGRLSGELVAAQQDSTWVLQQGALQRLHLSDIDRVQVRGRGLGPGHIMIWTLVGGVSTGAALTLACSGVSEGCGGVFLGTMLAWGVVGGLAAVITRSPHRWIRPESQVLAPYARFPQGMPAEFVPMMR